MPTTPSLNLLKKKGCDGGEGKTEDFLRYEYME